MNGPRAMTGNLLAAITADMLKPGHLACESCRDGVRALLAHIAALEGQVAEALAMVCDTHGAKWSIDGCHVCHTVESWDKRFCEIANELEEAERQLSEWRAGRMADATGHMLRCAKVNGVWACHEGCAVRQRDALRALVEMIRRDVASDQANRWCRNALLAIEAHDAPPRVADAEGT